MNSAADLELAGSVQTPREAMSAPDRAADSPQRRRCGRPIVEVVLSFALGIALMQYLYSATPDPANHKPLNVPGYDSFYHTKMAALLPRIGLPDQLVWLEYTVFRDRFVSHHYGFHLYLLPFVRAFDNPLAGARWAQSFSFGVLFALAMGLLIQQRVQGRWFWLGALLLLPADFYLRHSYIRAIDLSLICMLAGLLALFARHGLAVFAISALYTHVYLGSFFLLLLGGAYFVGVFARNKVGKRDLRLAGALLGGWVFGMITHPYGSHGLSFLWMQIFETGLNPQVSVGQEWDSYGNVWDYANMMGPSLTLFTAVLLFRALRGPTLNEREWTLTVATVLFVVLNLKAKRFVEYAPFFAVLAAAVMSRQLWNWDSRDLPMFANGSAPRDAAPSKALLETSPMTRLPGLLVLIGTTSLCAWLQWTTLSNLWGRPWMTGAIVFCAAYGLVYAAAPLASLLGLGRPDRSSATVKRSRLAPFASSASTLCLALMVLVSLATVAYPIHDRVRTWAKGSFDLPEIERVMNVVKSDSKPGDIIFTDDWDIFPVFFFFNDYNHYVAGLDPVFSYRRDPELWERYCAITQGRAPLSTTVNLPAKQTDGSTAMEKRQISILLEDIRNRFNARYVVADRDHKPFMRKLEKAPSLFERIDPKEKLDLTDPPAYVVYRVKPVPPQQSELGTLSSDEP